MRRQAVAGLVLALWVGAPIAAETAYVIDSMRVGLHAAANASDRPFANLVSGTAVEVLERGGDYARVRLADGREGWVKAAYIVTEKPAAARVLELEAEIDHLKGAVAEAQAAQAAAQQELKQLRDDIRQTAGSTETIEETIARLTAENRAYEERIEEYRYSLPLVWVLPAIVVALVAGFLGGLWWLDALIRRRHGGFRVY
jgi:SH3 domain protein